ncbi:MULTISPECIES: response regulator transcription factor [Yimella]|uniref:LuxR family two component transcriptional regulator n=1 Tax=Yimella lutea TaxID=587872 RepID=A0A542EBP1_9MICO|nr:MULTISPECIES: response regulator transcription factor [Yimella]MCG8654200.1 response regulator transcription factor [Yimella sp. NH-Cas1]RYG77355.1 response regulator transcription factor [Yimella sp. RIT 621]TQJ12731.1 LuxR family two component transcriptional regulator [Yimella lutea]
MTRVLITDDHPVVRAGLRMLLEAAGIEVVTEAASGTEAIELTRMHQPELVLMDLQLGPGMDGVAATAALRELPDPPHVLIVTTYDTDADILRAVEAGAVGYLLKDAPPDELIRAVRKAAHGETALAPVVADRLLASLRNPVQRLSARELEVLTLVADGASNREVARKIFVSEATVKSHLVHIFDKLGVDSRTAAVGRARDLGLLR